MSCLEGCRANGKKSDGEKFGRRSRVGRSWAAKNRALKITIPRMIAYSSFCFFRKLLYPSAGGRALSGAKLDGEKLDGKKFGGETWAAKSRVAAISCSNQSSRKKSPPLSLLFYTLRIVGPGYLSPLLVPPTGYGIPEFIDSLIHVRRISNPSQKKKTRNFS